jgi:hypothetical protein
MHQREQVFIPYDSRNKVLLGQNDPSGEDVPSKRRGTHMLEPHRDLMTSPVQAPVGKQ